MTSVIGDKTMTSIRAEAKRRGLVLETEMVEDGRLFYQEPNPKMFRITEVSWPNSRAKELHEPVVLWTHTNVEDYVPYAYRCLILTGVHKGRIAVFNTNLTYVAMYDMDEVDRDYTYEPE